MIDHTYDPRAALEIHRYHTWRTLRGQTNREHSCQIQRIMLTICPHVSRALLIHAVVHDIGEAAGDIPYPFKKDNPHLQEEHRKVERKVHQRMTNEWKLPPPSVLPHDDEKFFKMCEYLEMWEFGLTEKNLGNQYGALIAERCILQANRLAANMPDDIKHGTILYVTKRQQQENLSNG